MRKFAILLVVMLFAVVAVSCATNNQTSENSNSKQVKYTEARNYFFRNDAEIPEEALVTSQSEFDKLYSPAAYMGRDGQPTKIDFGKQMVIGVNLPVTNNHTDIEPVSLQYDNPKLTLVYRVKITERNMSWSMKPMLLLVVDKIDGVSHCELVEQK